MLTTKILNSQQSKVIKAPRALLGACRQDLNVSKTMPAEQTGNENIAYDYAHIA